MTLRVSTEVSTPCIYVTEVKRIGVSIKNIAFRSICSGCLKKIVKNERKTKEKDYYYTINEGNTKTYTRSYS